MPGMAPAARLPQQLLTNARLLPDREAILPLLPKDAVIAEVGVALGDFSERMIRICEPAQFIAIDLFDLHRIPEIWGRKTLELFSGGTHGEYYRRRFADLIEQGQVSVLEGDSTAVLETCADASLDVVYVDADHGYEAVKRELAVIRRKIKDNGWIILNDYIMNDYIMSDAAFSNAPYGVVQASNEFMLAENWEMIYLAFHPYLYCDVVLRKSSSAQVAEPVSICLHDALEARNERLERSLQAMRDSTSWRLTAPLRALLRAFTTQPR
jgi:Methyltransferase domain